MLKQFKKDRKQWRIIGLLLLALLFSAQSAPIAKSEVKATTAEESACSEEPKKQGKQYNDTFKMASFYSQRTKSCYYSFAESEGDSNQVKSGIRKKDAEGNVSVFFQYDGSKVNHTDSGMTIISINETANGDIAIGGSIWKPAAGTGFLGYYALLRSDGTSKVEKLSGGQSIEKIYINEKEILLAGSNTEGSSSDLKVSPHLIILDLNGNEQNNKTFSNTQGYWFNDIKSFKSKYYRVMLDAYKKGSGTSTKQVKWIDKSTLDFVDEQTVVADDQKIFMDEEAIAVENQTIVFYDNNGNIVKKIPYQPTTKRCIPLPVKNDDSAVVAEIDSTIKLVKIKKDGTVDKSYDTGISVASDDLLDFRKTADGKYILQVITKQGNETLHPLNLSSLNLETTEKPNESKGNTNTSQKSDTATKKEEQNFPWYFILAGIVALVAIVMAVVLFLKKQSKNKKPKAKKPIVNEAVPTTEENSRNFENHYGFEDSSHNTINQEAIDTKETHDDENSHSLYAEAAYDAYGNPIYEEVAYDEYGNPVNS